MKRAAILRKWDRIAYSQLCERASLLVQENDTLRSQIEALQARLSQTEEIADFWHENAIELAKDMDSGDGVGLTQSGKIVRMES